MKQALIDVDGVTVANVRIVDMDDRGAPLALESDPYDGPNLLLPDDHYCGVGMLWDGDASAPLFTYRDDLPAETASAWSKVKAFFGVGS